MDSFWERIDAVCVINLDHRQDRWEKLYAELHAFLPDEKLHRVSAAYGVELPGYKTHRLFCGCTDDECLFWAGRAGCVLSHARCLSMAQAHGWQHVMVLEDDATFLDDLKGSIGNMLSRLMDEEEWDMIFLGMSPYDDKGVLLAETQTDKNETVQACRILGPLNAHCYIVTRETAQRALALLPGTRNVWHWVAMNLSYDSWIANDFGKEPTLKIIGLYPIICVQRESFSNIETTVRSCSYSGSLGHGAFPITLVSMATFEARYRMLRFRAKKAAKILMHHALGVFYYMFGFRKFKVSVEAAGWIGALRAAWKGLKQRRQS